ncbi:putative nucleolus protein required for cell viability [Talaromyces proteolyticus]|uniref:Nucleolus protein required for cell viability n=1 Tax=Talaromyces proteolyticus TaxID=1131652 RepID=A0AAD4PSV8_9EURO|nr:putative nucleolus protein required for cell viability [Talaromyces proteolyticus]KAH8689713.1 putative nucleolus protein required for cell viability [Talaromyces proteolyticus]
MPHTSSKDDLNDDSLIQQLLNEAEARLQSASPVEKSLTSAASQHVENHANARLPELASGGSLTSYVHRDGEISAMYPTLISIPSEGSYSLALNQPAKKEKQDDAGGDWFNLPKTQITPELKREFQLLRMRNVLDPKRHYKKENGKANTPQYSQVGTIIEGPTEFFKSRVVKKDRKKTFAEEAIATENESGRFKAKYNQIQESKKSGKKSYYNSLRAKRRR